MRRESISEMVGDKSKSEWETVMTEAFGTLTLGLWILLQEIRKLQEDLALRNEIGGALEQERTADAGGGSENWRGDEQAREGGEGLGGGVKQGKDQSSFWKIHEPLLEESR